MGNITDFDGRVYSYTTSALPDGWEVVTGTWEMEDGVLDGQNAAGDALILAPARMTDGRIVARLASQSWESWKQAAIVFDYQDLDNFRFVRMRAGGDAWHIGERVAGAITHLETYTVTIDEDRYYDMEAVNWDGEVKFLVDGEYLLSHDFGSPFTHDRVGLFWQQAHTHMDWWQTTAMSPTTGASFDFASGVDGWQVIAGSWNAISGVYSGSQAGAQALSMIDGVTLSDGWISGTIETQSGYLNGHLVFGYEDSDNFASVCVDDYDDRWRIIQWQSGAAAVLAEAYESVGTGVPVAVQAVVRGGEVAMVVDGDHKLASRVRIQAGQAGLRVWGGTTYFDDVTVAPMLPLTTTIESFSEQPHAVKAIQHATGVDRYAYDGNGNMTFRVELSGTQPITYYQEFDIENRLTAVTVTDGITQTVSRFVYDGDGTRAKRVAPGGAETVYLGQFFEVEISGGTAVTTSYYYHAGRRVAMRSGGTLYYIYGDHLGSTSLTTNSSGGEVGRQLFHPYGTVRWSSGALYTDFTFTGQRGDSYLDILAMGARWYNGYINRWIQPDTIVPDLLDPQSLNRFSYVLGNPLRYVDPSGFDPLDAAWQRDFEAAHGHPPTADDILIRLFSIAFPEEWNHSDFYDADNNYIQGSLERVFRNQRPASRTWEGMPVALERLAGWYGAGEEGMFTRDIGSLFGGLANRIDIPGTWDAVSDEHNPVHTWVYVGREGLPLSLTGVADDDANVHHWAWALTMGAAYGPGGSVINTGREVLRQGGNWPNTWSDIQIGNRGAALGVHFRLLGLSSVPRAWEFFMFDHWF